MQAYLIFLPVATLFLAALGMVILQQARPSIGYAWLVAAVGGLLTVAAVVFLRWQMPLQVTLEPWRVFDGVMQPPAFRLDVRAWPYVFSLAVLALAFIFTDAARLETEARPLNWSAGLVLTGLGVLAVMAANPITLIVSWTALDLVEFFIVLPTGAGRRMGVQMVTAFSVRVGGTLLVIFAVLLARAQFLEFDLLNIPNGLAIFLLLAVSLRLGVLPLNLAYAREVYVLRGLGNMMRMIGPASGLVVLAHMPEQVVPPSWHALLLALTVLAVLYGSVMWLGADQERNGRPFWLIALAGLAVICVINQQPQASIAWGVALILTGSVAFFYSARRRRVWVIPLLALPGLLGLPFTPAASGWSGLVTATPGLLLALIILSVLCLVGGFVRHILRPREEIYRMERWVQTIYPAGLLALILAQWTVGLIGWAGSLTVGVWWVSVLTTFLAAGGLVAFFSLRGRLSRGAGAEQSLVERWTLVTLRRVGAVLGSLFRMNWLYGFFAWVYQLLQNVIQLLTAMFEGDGGILWSLVLLALLISIIWKGGS